MTLRPPFVPTISAVALLALAVLGPGCTTVGASAECSADEPCPFGSYCADDGFCASECEVGSDDCGDGYRCGSDGQCFELEEQDCPDVEVNLEPVVPTVVLLVDQSGSMNTDFGGGMTRWQAVQSALTDPIDGVVANLEDRVTFGATLYMSQGGDAGGDCPMLADVPPAQGNLGSITDLFADNGPIRDTPTAESVDATVQAMAGLPDPRYIVLATDGDPDTCIDPDSNGQQGPKDLSERAVQNAFSAGIETFILSVGTDATESHLQRLANAGRGLDLDSGGADFVVATDPSKLAASFDSIIRGVRSCDISLEEPIVPSQAQDGTVVLNGRALDFGADWELVDEQTLRLLEPSCSEFLDTDSVELSASFPCGAVVD